MRLEHEFEVFVPRKGSAVAVRSPESLGEYPGEHGNLTFAEEEALFQVGRQGEPISFADWYMLRVFVRRPKCGINAYRYWKAGRRSISSALFH